MLVFMRQVQQCLTIMTKKLTFSYHKNHFSKCLCQTRGSSVVKVKKSLREKSTWWNNTNLKKMGMGATFLSRYCFFCVCVGKLLGKGVWYGCAAMTPPLLYLPQWSQHYYKYHRSTLPYLQWELIQQQPLLTGHTNISTQRSAICSSDPCGSSSMMLESAACVVAEGW